MGARSRMRRGEPPSKASTLPSGVVIIKRPAPCSQSQLQQTKKPLAFACGVQTYFSCTMDVDEVMLRRLIGIVAGNGSAAVRRPACPNRAHAHTLRIHVAGLLALRHRNVAVPRTHDGGQGGERVHSAAAADLGHPSGRRPPHQLALELHISHRARLHHWRGCLLRYAASCPHTSTGWLTDRNLLVCYAVFPTAPQCVTSFTGSSPTATTRCHCEAQLGTSRPCVAWTAAANC